MSVRLYRLLNKATRVQEVAFDQKWYTLLLLSSLIYDDLLLYLRILNAECLLPHKDKKKKTNVIVITRQHSNRKKFLVCNLIVPVH